MRLLEPLHFASDLPAQVRADRLTVDNLRCHKSFPNSSPRLVSAAHKPSLVPPRGPQHGPVTVSFALWDTHRLGDRPDGRVVGCPRAGPVAGHQKTFG